MLIEINLAPKAGGSRTGSRKKKAALAMPVMPSVGMDARTLALTAAGVALLALVILGFWRMGGRQNSLEAQIEAQVADSTRFASTLALLSSLQTRQDTITRKIEVIRSVDTRRYVWPHVMDQISLAVPAFAWLTQVSSTEPADSLQVGPTFTIQGAAGSTQALTRFMTNLESSPFIENVTLITSEQEQIEGRAVQRFSLEASYQFPEREVIQTIPLVLTE